MHCLDYIGSTDYVISSVATICKNRRCAKPLPTTDAFPGQIPEYCNQRCRAREKNARVRDRHRTATSDAARARMAAS